MPPESWGKIRLHGGVTMKASRSSLALWAGVVVLGWALSGCGSADRAMREESPGQRRRQPSRPTSGRRTPARRRRKNRPPPMRRRLRRRRRRTRPRRPTSVPSATGSKTSKSVASPLLIGPDGRTASPKLQAKSLPAEEAPPERAVRSFSQPVREARSSVAASSPSKMAASPRRPPGRWRWLPRLPASRWRWLPRLPASRWRWPPGRRLNRWRRPPQWFPG